jgi:PAS domain S-box-containing protein
VGPRYIEVTCVPDGPPEGETRGFFALVNDITPRKHREDSEKLLRRADTLLSTSPDEPSVLRSFVALLVPGLADGCAIELGTSGGVERRLIVRRVVAEDPRVIEEEVLFPRRESGGEGPPEVFATGTSQLLPEVTDEMVERSASLKDQLDRLDLRPPVSALFVPLAIRGLTLGVVSLFSRRAGRTYSAEDLWLAEDLGRQAAGALEAARFHAEWSFETSHRLRTEEALRESRDRLRLESEAAELATWDWDVRAGVLTLNDRCKAIWALPDSAGNDYRLLLAAIHPEDRDRVERTFRDELKPDGHGACRAEFRVLGRNDGVERWVSCHGLVVHEPSGKPIRVVGTAVDISERKRVERELLFRKTLLESQTEAAIDGILVVDPVGRMISFNRRFVEMWGIPPEVVAARSDEAAIGSVLHKLADPEGFLSRVRYLYGHPNEESQDELCLKDGRTFDRYSAPVRDSDGGYYGRVWYFRDVTEKHHQDEELRQSASRLQMALDELNTFAYTVAHDLRAPLRAMAGFSRLLELEYGRALDQEAQDYVRRIAEAAERMDKLIQDLLAYSRVSRLSMRIETVDLGELLSEVLGRFQPEFQQRQARLDVIEPLPSVLAYRVALDQVLANLISNAVKFVAPGTRPEVRIQCEKTEERVRLSVLDNGIGISPDQQDRIFGVFERLHPTEYPGTGIGLAIVKRAMERMGGRVGVEIRPGGGSSFWIELRSPTAPPSD